MGHSIHDARFIYCILYIYIYLFYFIARSYEIRRNRIKLLHYSMYIMYIVLFRIY